MSFKSTIILFLILGYYQSLAQNPSSRKYIISKTNVAQLENIARIEEQKNKTSSVENRLLTPAENIIYPNGKTAYFCGYDINNEAIYHMDDNDVAARISRIDLVKKGSFKIAALDGHDVEIGHWEAGGIPRSTHVELDGSINQGESSPHSDHASHTACTMIGKGNNNSAEGMAPGATIKAFQSTNDLYEMSIFAKQGGLLSNHSYTRGGQTKELMGNYESVAYDWDNLTYNAPFYLVVKSAGNLRNDIPDISTSGFDLIYRNAGAKNVLSVGSINDISGNISPQSINLSIFSSTGPTDDWRIKPDITANGSTLFSATSQNNSSYNFASGTSMAAAVVSGGCAILQQCNHRYFGKYIKAATMKALIIHTADEAGPTLGPDFYFGWGLMNVQKAVNVMSNVDFNHLVLEDSLQEDQVYVREFIKEDQSFPVSATMCWADPAGEQKTVPNDRTPVLVNDLNMVIVSDKGEKFYPWVMEPNGTYDNFQSAAVKGINFRDNVEKIEIGDLPKGKYQLQVTHKGKLVDGKQAFSLIISGATLTPKDNELTIWPNPVSNGSVKVFVPEYSLKDAQVIQVFDIYGKCVYKSNVNESFVTINTEGFAKGNYSVTISGPKGYISKLITVL